jgi:hydrogenase nickel incorporation protein HypA/HybF
MPISSFYGNTMHEFGLGEEVVKTVLEEMKRISPPPHRLLSARIVVGAQHRIVPDHMRFIYEVLTRDTLAAGSSLEVSVLPSTALCPDCGWQGLMDESVLLCPGCDTGNLRTLHGMELFLDRLEVEYRDTSDSE